MRSSVEKTVYIVNCLEEILQAVYGRDVRRAIHDAIEWAVDSMVTLRDEINAWTDEMEAWKEALQDEWDYTKDDLYNLLDHLCYVNEKTGDVILTGNDILLNYTDLNSKTIGYCVAGTGSDLTTQEISQGSGDYQIVVTTGGLV